MLTVRQLRFIDAYVAKPDGANAARAAGYGSAGAKVRACELLARADVQQELRWRLAQRRAHAIRDGSIDIDPAVRTQLLDYFDGNEARARRAVEKVILAIVSQGLKRKNWSEVWAIVKSEKQ